MLFSVLGGVETLGWGVLETWGRGGAEVSMQRRAEVTMSIYSPHVILSPWLALKELGPPYHPSDHCRWLVVAILPTSFLLHTAPGRSCRPPGRLQHCCQHRGTQQIAPKSPAQAGDAGMSMVALHLRQATWLWLVCLPSLEAALACSTIAG